MILNGSQTGLPDEKKCFQIHRNAWYWWIFEKITGYFPIGKACRECYFSIALKISDKTVALEFSSYWLAYEIGFANAGPDFSEEIDDRCTRWKYFTENGHFGGFGPKWTVLGQRRRSSGSNWTVQATESRQSNRLKSDVLRKWTVLKSKRERPDNKHFDRLKEVKWTVVGDDSKRSKKL